MKATVIGSGMMGHGIAVTLALGGVEATILSRTEEGANRGVETARQQLVLLETNGLTTAEKNRWALETIKGSTAFDESVAEAELVIESTPEDMEFKQQLFAQLDTVAQPTAVLASNTSGLSISMIAKLCLYPERVLTTHFWNPA